MSARKVAVFDIDGTLYRWQFFHELVQELTLTGVFPNNTFHAVDNAWNDWRGGNKSFHGYENLVVETLLKYLPLIPTAVFEAACDKVIEQSGHKLHAYPKALLKKLKADGYAMVAISGSQQELLERFGRLHGFDIVIGALYERVDGRFTGNVTRTTVGRKQEILAELINSGEFTLEGSVAIGDSEGDIALLAMVERPIAFNPSEGLFNEAKKNRWPIVIERKNIAYQLDHKDETLVLANTIIY
jgi:HAD superfamily hydrolase (TIGR01490 family)